jgi:succinate-semialdehyde dehydrogenase/glutarate-semialdehyde dehydrogenase
MRLVSAGQDVLGRELVSTDPATLAPVGRVTVTPPEELSEALAEARMAQLAFSREPLEARARLLERVAHAVVEEADAIAATIVAETGKPLAEAYAHELVVGADTCRWLAANLAATLGDERLPFRQLVLRQKRGWVRYRPLGVVGVVTPWNFPLALPLRHAAAAVAAGNAAVVKPSELTPLTGAWVEELFRRAGAPAGLVRVVQGPGETLGDALVRHRGVRAVVFTGSTEVGRSVAQMAAGRLCPTVMELGGKDAMLVLDDADLDRAVEGALWGTFTNCGQACAAIERIAVPRALHDDFVDRLVERARTLRIGHGADADVDLGPLIGEEQRARFESLIMDAVEHGATVATGGRRPDIDLPGWFHEPTVLLGEPRHSRLRTQELFGPAAVVVKVDTEDEMVRWANESPFALGASVWSRDVRRARAIAAELEVGSAWINDHAYSFGAAQAPWGSLGGSGIGRTGSRHGLYALSDVTFVGTDAGRLTPGWWYPYAGDAVDGLRGLLGALYGRGARARGRSLVVHRRGLVHLVREVLA